MESRCELLDFDLDGEAVSCSQIMDRLNESLVEGVKVLSVYDTGTKLKNLFYLDTEVVLEYDTGIPEGAGEAISGLFSREMLVLEKKGKNGTVQQDIIPMIRSAQVQKRDENTLCICARICCQNPTLNPAQLAAAVNVYLPEFAPDHSTCRRLEIYDTENKVFR